LPRLRMDGAIPPLPICPISIAIYEYETRSMQEKETKLCLIHWRENMRGRGTKPVPEQGVC
jgi:hypothetical protein